MATETYGVNDPQAVKLWKKTVQMEAFAATSMAKFMGETEDSLLVKHTEFNKSEGDRITCHLADLLSGDGFLGNEVAEGNEEAGENYTDNLFIDELRNATKVDGKGSIGQQRVPYNLRAIGKDRLKNWFAERFDTAFLNQLAGNTAETRVKYTGNNTTTAPSAGRHLWCDVSSTNKVATGTTDQAVGASSTDIITIDALIATKQRAIQKDSNGNYRMRPIMIGGKKCYVAFLHPNQITDLRNDTTSAGSWFDIQQAALQGGDIVDNPIFTGAHGMIDGIIIHESEYVPRGVNTSTGLAVPNTRRAVLCGANAANVAFAAGNDESVMSWAEKLEDYGKKLGILAGTIYGLKKTVFNAKDYGAFVLTSYSADI